MELPLRTKSLILLMLLVSPFAYSGMAPFSVIKGKVITFDDKKVKLQVGKELVYVPRASIEEKNLKEGVEVESISKNEVQEKKKK